MTDTFTLNGPILAPDLTPQPAVITFTVDTGTDGGAHVGDGEIVSKRVVETDAEGGFSIDLALPSDANMAPAGSVIKADVRVGKDHAFYVINPPSVGNYLFGDVATLVVDGDALPPGYQPIVGPTGPTGAPGPVMSGAGPLSERPANPPDSFSWLNTDNGVKESFVGGTWIEMESATSPRVLGEAKPGVISAQNFVANTAKIIPELTTPDFPVGYSSVRIQAEGLALSGTSLLGKVTFQIHISKDQGSTWTAIASRDGISNIFGYITSPSAPLSAVIPTGSNSLNLTPSSVVRVAVAMLFTQNVSATVAPIVNDGLTASPHLVAEALL